MTAIASARCQCISQFLGHCTYTFLHGATFLALGYSDVAHEPLTSPSRSSPVTGSCGCTHIRGSVRLTSPSYVVDGAPSLQVCLFYGSLAWIIIVCTSPTAPPSSLAPTGKGYLPPSSALAPGALASGAFSTGGAAKGGASKDGYSTGGGLGGDGLGAGDGLAAGDGLGAGDGLAAGDGVGAGRQPAGGADLDGGAGGGGGGDSSGGAGDSGGGGGGGGFP